MDRSLGQLGAQLVPSRGVVDQLPPRAAQERLQLGLVPARGLGGEQKPIAAASRIFQRRQDRMAAINPIAIERPAIGHTITLTIAWRAPIGGR
jgi:hypothetical protein